MVALNFNANSVQPSYGGDAGLPDGLYDTVIIKTAQVPVEKMGAVVGAYLEITHSVIDGPLKGQTMVDRLNLSHSNPQTVEIANKQLSAYCHVLGQFNVADSQQLHNIPMKIEVGRQIDKNTKQPTTYGEIKKIYDRNGNAPGKAGAQGVQHAPPAQPQTPPPAGVHAEGGGWNGGGQPQNPPQGFGQPDQSQPQGGFGQPQPGQPQAGFGQPQGGPQPDPNAASGANWGAPAGGPQPGAFGASQPDPSQGAGGGWSPSGQPQGGPSWGAR